MPLFPTEEEIENGGSGKGGQERQDMVRHADDGQHGLDRAQPAAGSDRQQEKHSDRDAGDPCVLAQRRDPADAQDSHDQVSDRCDRYQLVERQHDHIERLFPCGDILSL